MPNLASVPTTIPHLIRGINLHALMLRVIPTFTSPPPIRGTQPQPVIVSSVVPPVRIYSAKSQSVGKLNSNGIALQRVGRVGQRSTEQPLLPRSKLHEHGLEAPPGVVTRRRVIVPAFWTFGCSSGEVCGAMQGPRLLPCAEFPGWGKIDRSIKYGRSAFWQLSIPLAIVARSSTLQDGAPS
jgi:hypothetical protein